VSSEVLRRAAAAAVRRARDLGARTVAAELLGDRLTARQRAQAVVEGAILGTYHFDRYKREKAERIVSELASSSPTRAARARPRTACGEGRASRWPRRSRAT
jgi:leucyl aminopeptidase